MNIDSNLVRKYRAEKNWSQEKLSEAAGLSLRTIQRLESSGKASIESARALAAAFGVEPTQLVLPDEDKGLTPLEAIKTAFMQFGNFTDTATRFEYWWFAVFVLLVAAIAVVIDEQVYQIALLILLVPLLAAGTRRLNDVGRSGWWQLFFLVPFGVIVVGFLLAEESKGSAGRPSSTAGLPAGDGLRDGAGSS